MNNAQRILYNKWRLTGVGQAYERAVLDWAPDQIYIELVKPRDRSGRVYIAGYVSTSKVAHFYRRAHTPDEHARC
jgi:hypothetical protein